MASASGSSLKPNLEDIRDYELMVILPPDITEADLKAKVSDIEGTITQHGGKILDREVTPLRDFAYRIRKHDRGFYATLHFSAPIDRVNELERFVRIESGALRHLLVACPKHYEFKGLMAYVQEAEALSLKEAEEKKAKAEEQQQRKMSARPARAVRPEKPAAVPAQVANVPAAAIETKKPELSKVDEQLKAILDNPDIQI
jgi:small subunit ribosomal protein S6